MIPDDMEWVYASYMLRKGDDERGLFVRVTCVDVVVGSATFARAEGLAHAILDPSKDYPMIAPYARTVGEWLATRRYWSAIDGDLTDVIAEVWGVSPIRLVADFRPDHARVAAALATTVLGSCGRTRPAA